MKTALVLSSMGLALAALAQPKLIEFGWDEPDTEFLSRQTRQLEATPFDGCVFHADYARKNGTKGSFTWQAWGTNAFTPADLEQAFTHLKGVRAATFKYNFLRFNTTPAKLDWFDDYSAIVANARLAAQLARAGNCPGILFDIEQYEGPLFNYRKQRDAKTKPWEIYADQVRKRGAEVMAAFQEGFPDLVVFLTFGYSLPWAETGSGKTPLAGCSYGLLAPFLDGMLQTAKGNTRIVDGCELAYGYKTAQQFDQARQMMTQQLLPIVADPEKYRRFFSFGYGLWLDFDWRKKGWNIDDPSANYFSPEAFQKAVGEALAHADDYVWIYTETPRWWSAEGRPVKLPAAYMDALRAAKRAPAAKPR